MERLQAAIEKARAQREARQPKPLPQSAEPAKTAEGPWDDIPMPNWDRAHMAQSRVVAFGSGAQSSAVDMMRTRIVQQMRQNGWKRLAITSPDKGVGKSTTCANLLVSLSRQLDRRMIFFDLDMRRPSMASILGHSGEEGVAAVLSGRVPFDKQAVRFSESTAVSLNYRPERNSSEILLADTTSWVLDQIEKTYEPDIMIFDMPPMLIADDTLAFLKNVDCCLLLAGADATTIREIDACEKEIAGQTNVLGVALNKCRYPESAYGYDYY